MPESEGEVQAESQAQETLSAKEGSKELEGSEQCLEETVQELSKGQDSETALESKSKLVDAPNLVRAIAYAGKNIYNFLIRKGDIDKTVKENLSKDLKGKSIYVALHGLYQTYWSSFADLVNYANEEGIVVVPIKRENPEQIYNDIKGLKDKTGAKIHVIGHSQGGKEVLDAVLDHGLGTLVEKIIISGAPLYNLNGEFVRPEYSEIGYRFGGKKLTNIYGTTDTILPLFGKANYGLEGAKNIQVNMGHMDLLHNPKVFEIYIPNVASYQLPSSDGIKYFAPLTTPIAI